MRWRVIPALVGLCMIGLLVATISPAGISAATGPPARLLPPPPLPPLGQPRVLTGHTAPITALAWSPDGQILASSAAENDFANGTLDPTVRLWRADGTLVAILRGHTRAVTSLAWSPDGTLLATGSRNDNTVRLWSATGQVRATLDTDRGPILSLAWAPDGRVLAVGSVVSTASAAAAGISFNGIVRLVRPDGTLLRTLHTDAGGGKWLNLGWSPDGSVLAAGAWGFTLWHRDGTPLATIPRGSSPAPAMAVAPDGRLLATGDESGFLALYALTTGQLITRLRPSGTINSLAFAPDGQRLAVLARDVLWLVNARQPETTPIQVAWTGSPGRTSNVAWSPDGAWLAAQITDHPFQVWSADGTPAAIPAGCGAWIDVVAWSPDGHVLATGGDDRHVCLWPWPAGSAHAAGSSPRPSSGARLF